jgi:hypothetical protein
MDAYERVLGDAISGDRTLFARQDYVEEAWRIVDPVLKKATPVYEYEAGSWGPCEADKNVTPPGGSSEECMQFKVLADSGAAESSITGVRIYRRKRRGDG